MIERIKLVQGDTRPAIVCTITDTNTCEPINLTDTTVVLKFREVEMFELTATVNGILSDPLNGEVVFYPATSPEMLQGFAGAYEGEIEITFPDGTIQTVYQPLKFKVREEF